MAARFYSKISPFSLFQNEVAIRVGTSTLIKFFWLSGSIVTRSFMPDNMPPENPDDRFTVMESDMLRVNIGDQLTTAVRSAVTSAFVSGNHLNGIAG